MGVVLGNIDEGLNDGLPGEYAPPDPGLAPVNITAPVVTGTAIVDGALHSTDGTWHYSVNSYLYIWRQQGGTNCTGDGFTTADYTPNLGDVGFAVYCEVTAQNSAGDSMPAASNDSAAVAAASSPVNLTAPVITSNATLASPIVGDVLTVSTPGTYSGSPTPSLTYQWKHGSDDSNATGTGATTTAYTADASDETDTLYCHETATNTAGSTSADSNESGAVSAPPAVPEITQFGFQITTNGGSLGGQGFAFSTVGTRYGVWFNADGGNSQPDLGAATYYEVGVSGGDDATTCAATAYGVISFALSGFTYDSVRTITLTSSPGAQTDATSSTADISVNITQQGSD